MLHIQVKPFFLISHRLSAVGLRPSSSLSTGCVAPLRGDWAIFCHTLAQDGLAVRSAREKSLEIQPRGWDWTQATGRTDSELFHWDIMTRATGRTDGELSHWDTMTRAMERTDSDLSHWAIMTRATERTDSELFHWAIMTDGGTLVSQILWDQSIYFEILNIRVSGRVTKIRQLQFSIHVKATLQCYPRSQSLSSQGY